MQERNMSAALPPADTGQPVTIGRYILHRQIARGGMATIHFARLMGDEGFSRIVAAKRLHPEFAEDQEFVAMFLDEARIASKVHHRNVVPVLDVVTAGNEVILVQEYVHGVPLQWLLRTMVHQKLHMPVSVAVSIGCQVLAGLQATHDATDELGTPLHIVHRDVSPQNVMIATDGTARLLDFGVAKATMAAHVTREGTYKGKLAYSAPEQLRGQATKQSDVYSLSVLLWELLVGQRMHGTAKSGPELVATVLNGAVPTISEALTASHAWELISAAERKQLELLDPVVSRGLAVDLRERFSSAAEMEDELIAAVRPAPPSVVASWLRAVGKEFLEGRDRLMAEEEASWRRLHPVGPRSSPPPTSPHQSSIKLKPVGAERTLPHEQESLELPGSEEVQARLYGNLPLLLMGTAVLALVVGYALAHRSESATSETVPHKPSAREQGAARVEERLEPPRLEAPSQVINVQELPAALPEAQAQKPVFAQERDGEPSRGAQQGKARVARRTRAERLEPHEEDSSPPTQAQPAAAPKPQVDCSTPYYFEGTKKVFKPACI